MSCENRLRRKREEKAHLDPALVPVPRKRKHEAKNQKTCEPSDSAATRKKLASERTTHKKGTERNTSLPLVVCETSDSSVTSKKLASERTPHKKGTGRNTSLPLVVRASSKSTPPCFSLTSGTSLSIKIGNRVVGRISSDHAEGFTTNPGPLGGVDRDSAR